MKARQRQTANDRPAPAKAAGRRPALVVGIGASAGGLDALKEFFKAMPPDSGMAFVVVQHLEPAHESQMAAILSHFSAMSVAQAEEGMPVQANRVYTIPASKYLGIRAGRLRLSEPQERHGMRMAIDFFFRSLAEDQQQKAVCIILSGSGSDGTHGLRAVRSAGGMGMAQDPRTAQFGIMPQSAIDTGLVDSILPAGRMPAALVAYAQHPCTARAAPGETADAGPSDELDEILELLRSRTNSDYRCYKKGTIVRRIERRMGLQQVAGMEDYLQLLRRDPQELLQLARDMLIGVSAFFRDPEAFDELRRLAIDPLVAGRSAGNPLRVWVPGCATGEEAYSLTILLLEALAAAGKTNTIQVFASDADGAALETARAGVYGDSIATDVSAERRERFFLRRDDHYQVGKRLREAVVFARQNLIADPPFSRMDLIACRNVLIYLQPEAQRRVISLFSFALNVGGYLFLGKSEALADPRELFETVSKPRRIYRLARPNRHAVDLPAFSGAGRAAGIAPERPPAPPSTAELTVLNQQVLLDHFGAAIVLVEPKGRILHFHGRTEKYLGHPTGLASLNVLDMASGSLATRLRRGLAQAHEAGAAVSIRQVPVSRKGSPRVDVTIVPLPGRAGEERILAILLEDAMLRDATRQAAPEVLEDPSALAQLEAENRALRAELDAASEEHGSASEELRAANEEVMSMNEELQSANEELETSKEELQSINEELNTVNTQLNEKVGELTEANDDLANLAGATDIATVFLDARQRIKQFTPRATELLNLIPSDAGRPLSHITQNFDGKSLAAVAASVMKEPSPVEREVQIPDGRWFTMRVLPYRTRDNHIDGAVVTFTDVSRLKELENSLQRAKAYAESIVGTVREPLLVLDSALRVVSANPSYYQRFQAAPQATIGAFLYDLGEGQWNDAGLRKLLEEILPERSEFKDFQLEHEFPRLGRRIMRLNARRMEPAEDQPALILLAIEDVTEREQARRQIEALAVELEHRVQERTAELTRTVAEVEHIYHTAPAGLGLLDSDLRFVRVNERLAAMNGRPVSEHIGRSLREVAPEVAELMEEHARRVLETGEPLLNLEGRGLIPGKANAHWLASYLPVKAADGTISGLSGMVLDITERKVTEERILATDRFLGLFARETTRQAYLESALALLQQAAGGCRCVGIRLRQDSGEIPFVVHTGFSPEFLEAESRLRLGRDECACTRSIAGRPLPCDTPALTAAGSFFCKDTLAFLNALTEEEKRFFRGVCVQSGFASVAVVPIRYRGTVLGVIHLADEQPGRFPQDVVEFMEGIGPLIGEATHRFDVEEDLRKSEQRYRSLVVATSQIVWTTDPQGEVAEDLPSWRAFTGQGPEEVKGRGWAGALHPEDRQRTIAVWSQAVQGRTIYDTEYRIRRADGVYRDFAARGVPVLDPDGSIREWVGTCTDVTERRQAEAQLVLLNETLERRVNERTAELARSNAELEQFAYVTSHDLKEPLRMVTGFMGLLQEHGQGQLGAKANEYIGFAVDAAARMERLIDDLLTYSRVGRAGPAESTEVNSAVDRAMGNLAAAVAESAARITREPLPLLQANATELTQLFQNLIGNAIKFRRPGVAPEVHITASRTGQRPPAPSWLFTVRDNGIGIPAGQGDRIFQIFERLHARDEYPGTGVGLAICKKIVERHGGRIWVESRPGEGSTFFFTLPG